MHIPRECNGCSECCGTHNIPTLEKPPHSPCPNCLVQGGCAIYAKRPSECAEFSCAYRDRIRPEDTWPKHSGFVQHEELSRLLGMVWTIAESRPGALHSTIVEREIRWALGENYIVHLETVNSVRSFIIPAGRKVSCTARMFLGDTGASFILEKDFFANDLETTT